MKNIIPLLFILGSCTAIHPSWSKSDVVLTITDRERGLRKEWIDTDGNESNYELIATSYICNGRVQPKPSSIYDVRTGIFYLERHLVKYSRNRKMIVIPGDNRC